CSPWLSASLWLAPAPLNSWFLFNPERKFPKPFLSVSPRGVTGPGENVTFRCVGEQPSMRFALYNNGRLVKTQDPSGNEAVFPITSVGLDDRGMYTCWYRTKSELTEWSKHSDPVELVVAAGPASSYLSPSRQVTPGGAVTIRCQGWHQNATFLLYKDGNPKVLQDTEPAGDMAEFPISSVSRRDAGSYCCRYSTTSDPPIWSHLSDPGAGGSWWGAQPHTQPGTWGGSELMGCSEPGSGQYSGMMFFLHKAGHPNLQVRTVRDWTVAEFPIPSASQEDGGSYTCDYCPITDQSRWSYPSDPVEIIVGEPSYPKPSISLLSPSGGVSLGGAMTVRCRGQYLGKRFMLNKEGRHVQSVDSDGFGAEFPISHVSREDGGRYSCSYRSKSELFTESYPSDPVELVVRGERPGSAFLFPAPPPARPSWGLGANGTFRTRLCLAFVFLRLQEMQRIPPRKVPHAVIMHDRKARNPQRPSCQSCPL
uniref:Ig-like domain-containing protein n=1 Tax=Chelonoidis abingdonii TaxID=106734 RepID=A0A8C0GYZ8_CHEAB